MQQSKKAPRESAADKLGREAYISLFLASRQLTDEVEKVCRDEQIAMSHYAVLWFLARRGAPDGVPMGAVVDGHVNRTSDATRLADKLISLGMIERLASANDRRVVLVRLTEKGRDTYLRLTRSIQALHRRQWDALSSSELVQLRRLLIKVLGDSGEKLAALAATAG
jgi:DNA-binding MarR family transcriptional regulator